ncbi:hypothetical protein F4808DRAFT_437712, partial [Astrocystis sublimbata]
MHSTTRLLFATAALASSSLAQKSDSAFCSAYFTSFLSVIDSEAPETPSAIVPYFLTATPTPTNTNTNTITSLPPPTTTIATPAPLTTLDFASHAQQLCAIATELPPSLIPDFTSYASSLLSWGKKHS